MKTKPSAGELDAYIGMQIKNERERRGQTQHDLAEVLEMSYQQIQKYESGYNRISAANLYKLAKYFNRPIKKFLPE